MVMDINDTQCAHQFAIYTCIKSICCVSKTNTMLYVRYISIKIFLEVTFLGYMHSKGSCVHWLFTFLCGCTNSAFLPAEDEFLSTAHQQIIILLTLCFLIRGLLINILLFSLLLWLFLMWNIFICLLSACDTFLMNLLPLYSTNPFFPQNQSFFSPVCGLDL